jgi:hypothetical protein
MQTEVSQTLAIGAKVRRYRSSSVFRVREIDPVSGWVGLTKIKRDGSEIKMCNGVDIRSLKPFEDKSPWKDKDGRTAVEAARETFKPGDRAIYLVLGDIYTHIKAIRQSGAVETEHGLFSPDLEHDAEWGWWNESRYSLRKDDGDFSEYSD